MNTESTTGNGLYPAEPEAPEHARSYPLVAADEVRAAATDFEQQLRTLVRERPVVAVFTAAGIGYFLARLFSRGMR